MYEYNEITCSNACHKVKSGVPYKWDLNVYRGCEHGCKYCFALYTHKYMKSNDFFKEIYVKKNIAGQLDKLLSSKNWKGEPINLGGVTDNYQPAEEKYKIMSDIWEVLIKHKNPCTISTKSDLILRDFDLIKRLADVTYVSIAATITCADEKIRMDIEPGGVSSERRFEMLRIFKENTNSVIGLHIMPVIPFLTDTDENLDELFLSGKNVNVDYAILQALNLRGETKNVFLSFIREKYPRIYNKLCLMYRNGYADGAYREALYVKAADIMKKYNISNDYSLFMEKRLEAKNNYEQISLFE